MKFEETSLTNYLSINLPPSTKADPAFLAKYVTELLNIEKPMEELKKICAEKLVDFLGNATDLFVTGLFEAIDKGSVVRLPAKSNVIDQVGENLFLSTNDPRLRLSLSNKRIIEKEGEDKREERLIANQAQLGVWLRKKIARRVLGVKHIDSGKTKVKPPKPWLENVMPFEVGKRRPGVTSQFELRMETKDRVISLTDVVIRLPTAQGGETTAAGTLETHANGFLYTASNFRKHFYFQDIKNSFFRLGDYEFRPLLHFQLHDPFENTKDIEFHMVKFPRRDKIHGEKKIRESLNKRLWIFVDKVYARWSSMRHSPCLFHELEKKYEFRGVFSSKASVFNLTSNVLIGLFTTPFTVFPLRDIDFVNLALLRSGEIDMTIVFQDYNKEDSVLEVKSIPLMSLDMIKDGLNDCYVKYYVNTLELEWKAIVKDIVAFPQKFIEKGGWDYFNLEDPKTLAYYDSLEETELDLKGVTGQMVKKC